MFNIRRGAFETNSSSMHAIIICNNANGDMDDNAQSGFIRPHPLEGMVLEYTDLEFVDSQGLMTSWIDKLGYLIASRMQYDTYDEELGQKVLNKYLNIVRKHRPEIQMIKVPILRDEHKEFVEYEMDINHQSQDLIKDFFADHWEIGEEEFIFNNNYVMYISWDGMEYNAIIASIEDDERKCETLYLPWGEYKVHDGVVNTGEDYD